MIPVRKVVSLAKLLTLLYDFERCLIVSIFKNRELGFDCTLTCLCLMTCKVVSARNGNKRVP